MNELIKIGTQRTMSSREIAEITNKRHPDVKRDIEVMFEGLKEDVSRFAHVYADSMNRAQTEYLLPFDEFTCLITGYSAKHRMDLIKRWKALETGEAQPMYAVPKNLGEALKLAADLFFEKQKAVNEAEQANTKLLAQAPAIEYVNTVLDAKNSMPITVIAKELGISAQALNKLLFAKGVQFKQGKTWVLYSKYQSRIDLVKVVTHPYISSRGENCTAHELQWTEAGRKFIHGLVKAEQTA